MASGTGLQNIGSSKDREGQVVVSGTGLQNIGSSKDRERPGGGLRYRATEPRQQQGQGEARRLPQVQEYIS